MLRHLATEQNASNMKTKLFLNFLLLIFFSSLKSQGHEKTPLIDFLQKNFDSTIIYAPTAHSQREANYFILSKNEKRYYLFTYRSQYKNIGIYPDELKTLFVKEHIRFTQTIPDTNRYFLPKTKYNQDSILALKWREVVSDDSLWHLPDDAVLGEPKCSEGGPDCRIYDATTDVFILITPHVIKSLSFYAPEFFEQCCNAEIPGRRNELRIRAQFCDLFREELD